MMRTAVLIALTLVLAACDAPTIPARDAFYEFTLPDPPLVFHWPAGSSVRIFVAGGSDAARADALSDAAAHAADAWNDVALFGEFDVSETPDVLRCSAIGGRAVTTFCPDPEGTRLMIFPLRNGGAGRTRFVINISAAVVDDAELRRLVTHEVGHALGLWNHPAPTSFPESVMLSVPSTDVPTAIDRATVQVLYHTAPNVSL